MFHRLFLPVFLGIACSGCGASHHYKQTNTGQSLSGSLVVEWMEPDYWLYTPSKSNPLTFVRADGTVITPQKMFTDGGSIPRPLWVMKNYSPWGYGPAFIIHDWLFHMQDCGLAGWEDWTVEEAAMVMSEVMKTMMETPNFDFGDKTTVYLMYEAVQSPPARAAWSDRDCRELPSVMSDFWRPTQRFEIAFDDE